MEQTFFQELFAEIFGDTSAALWVSIFIFAGIGIAINIIIGYLLRDKTKSTSAEGFSFKFFTEHNKKRLTLTILLTILIIFVAARFLPNISGQSISSWWALVIGLGLDFIVNSFIKKRLDWVSKLIPKK